MRIVKTLAIALAVMLATTAVAYGADQVRQRDQSPDRVKLQQQKRDGSCQDVTTTVAGDQAAADDPVADRTPAQTRDRDRDQLRDGSCGDDQCPQTQAQTRDRTQDREQDCTQTQTQVETRSHDGNAWDDGDAGHEGQGAGGHGAGPGHNGDGRADSGN